MFFSFGAILVALCPKLHRFAIGLELISYDATLGIVCPKLEVMYLISVSFVRGVVFAVYTAAAVDLVPTPAVPRLPSPITT